MIDNQKKIFTISFISIIIIGIILFCLKFTVYSNRKTVENKPLNATSSGMASSNIVTNYEELITSIHSAEKNGSGTIYLKGSIIHCTGQIPLTKSGANITIEGIQNSDGSYPVLDFSAFRSNYIGKKTDDNQAGIRITGSYYTIKNLIIQKAPDNGIQIKGISAGNNTIANCITRYNNDAGLQISTGAYSNSIQYVYSYRNCDVYTLGGNADGFAPKLAAGKNNTFYGCYAWENSDDGWDSYDKTDGLTYDLSYTHCACWNNGDPSIFTGEYDYKKGNKLDTNLFLVELISTQDSNFISNYNNGNFSLPSGNFIITSFGSLSINDWKKNYGGNPNGFKFGSANSTKACIRTVNNCLAFGHSKKGFDNNNSSCSASFSNCIAFDNGYNYYIPTFTLSSFNNINSFSGNSKDNLPSGFQTSTPNASIQTSIRDTVNSTVNDITSKCSRNVIPGKVLFNIY